MNIDSYKENIRYKQEQSIYKTREIINTLNQTQDVGSESLKMLNEQYEKLKRCDSYTENINHNLETSSDILGKIKHFFFPRKACKIEKLPQNNDNDDVVNNVINVIDVKSKNKDIKIKSEFVDKDIENELDNNIDEINLGVQNLKTIALTMNSQLDLDAKLLDKVNTKAEVNNRNLSKMNKKITKLIY
jgi:hypothetical protein